MRRMMTPGPLGLAGDAARAVADEGRVDAAGVDDAGDALGVVGDGRQRLVQLVGDVGRHLAQDAQARELVALLAVLAGGALGRLAPFDGAGQLGGAPAHQGLHPHHVEDPPQHGQRREDEPGPVLAQDAAQGGVAQVGIGADAQLAEQRVDAGVVLRRGPGPAVHRRHGQQGGGHRLGQVRRGAGQAGEGPVRVQARGQPAGEAAGRLLGHHGELVGPHPAGGDLLLQQAGAQHPGIGPALAQRGDDGGHRKAGAHQGLQALGRHAGLVHLAPDHPPAAEGIGRDHGQAAPGQIGKARGVARAVGGDDGGAHGVGGHGMVAAFQRGQAGDAVAGLQLHVVAGVGDDEVHRVLGHRQLDAGRVQRRQLEMVRRQRGVEVGQRGLEVLGRALGPWKASTAMRTVSACAATGVAAAARIRTGAKRMRSTGVTLAQAWWGRQKAGHL
jgi:hypothetical protein